MNRDALSIGLLAVVLVVATLATPATIAATPVAAANETATGTPTGSPTATPTGNASSAPSTPSTPTTTPAGRPSAAQAVRVLPVSYDRDFISIETVERGRQYNVSGPWAEFSLSTPVEQAVVSEPGASTRMLGGGRVVKVTFDPGAAPVGSTSLYHLRLYFPDGSTRTIKLYVTRTGVDVGSTQLQQYRPLIIKILNDAETSGYERSPEGALKHYKDLKETAQLLENLLSKQAMRAALTLWSWVTNPFSIALTLAAIAGVSLYLIKRRGSVLDVLSNNTGKSQQLREKLWLSYIKQQQTAADERLSEVPEIDGSRELYWRDAYGVETVAGLAELFRQGVPVEKDGEVRTVGSVDELEAQEIHDSWLEPVLRPTRIPSPELALADGKNALKRMVSKYGLGHHYWEPLQRTRQLIDELDESSATDRHASSIGSLGSTDRSPGVAGGDD